MQYVASFPGSPLVIILTFELTCECKVKGQMIKTRNASIRKGREPGNEAMLNERHTMAQAAVC